MVKALQRKFIIAAMLVVTILLATLVGAINLLNYASVIDRQKKILDMLCSADAMPDRFLRRPDGYEPGQDKRAEKKREREDLSFRSEEEQKKNNVPAFLGRRFSVDQMMSTRFFAVWFNEDGNALEADVSRIYAVSREEALELGESFYLDLRKRGRTEGISGDFRYLLASGDGGFFMPPEESAAGATLSGAQVSSLRQEPGAGGAASLLVAMDIGGDTEDLVSVLAISGLIACLCWLAMLVPVFLLARLAIAPTAQSIERQKQFVTDAGHELKTPVAIIQANTEALELFNGQSKWTRNIRAQTVRLTGLMQNLLTLAKMDEKGLQLKMQTFSLGDLAGEVWEHFAESAAGRQLAFAVKKPDKGRDTVLANRETIAQLCSILYDNAVKYAPRGSSIEVDVTLDGTRVRLVQSNEIAEDDQGEDGKGGIPEDPGRLFERFYRTDQDRSRHKGGYGIGLSAARSIAEANRGSIRAEAEAGRISFILSLPKAPEKSNRKYG